MRPGPAAALFAGCVFMLAAGLAAWGFASRPLQAQGDPAPDPAFARSLPETGGCLGILEREVPALQNRLEDSVPPYERLLEAARRSLDFVDNNLAQMALDRAALAGLAEKLDSAEEDFATARQAYAAGLDRLLEFGPACADDGPAFAAAARETLLERRRLEEAAGAAVDLVEVDFETAFGRIDRQLMEVPGRMP